LQGLDFQPKRASVPDHLFSLANRVYCRYSLPAEVSINCFGDGFMHHIRITRLKLALVALSLMLLYCGCSTYRFMPSHGGGKRFDEEQRVVATAARSSVAQMDLKALVGRRVNISMTVISQSGGGTVNMPGFTSIGAGYNNKAITTAPSVTRGEENWSANVNYNPTLNAWPSVFDTNKDTDYLDASVQMKLRQQGTAVGVNDPNTTLYVVVDVFGTNRSRRDSLLYWEDTLIATCELTYYAVEAKSGKLIIPAQRAGSQSAYRESGCVLLVGINVDRSQAEIVPTPMATDPMPVILSDAPAMTSAGIDVKAVVSPSDKTLDDMLKDVDRRIEAGDLATAENIVNKIRTASPEYEGLSSVVSRLNAAKAAQTK
jgi:hypothetical protein